MLVNNIFGFVIVISLCIDTVSGAPQTETAKGKNEDYPDETKSFDVEETKSSDQTVTASFSVEDDYYEDNITTLGPENDVESLAQHRSNYQELVVEEVTGDIYEEIMNITTRTPLEYNHSTTPTTEDINFPITTTETLKDLMETTNYIGETTTNTNESTIISNLLASKKPQGREKEEVELSTDDYNYGSLDSQDSGEELEEIYHMQCEDDKGNLVLSGYKRIYFPMVVNNANYTENVSLPTVIKGNFTADFAACEFIRLSPVMLQVKIYSLSMQLKDFDCPLFPNNTDEERHPEWLPMVSTRMITLEYLYHDKDYSKRTFTGGYVVGNSCYASYFHDCLQNNTNITCFGANCPACMPFHLTFNLVAMDDPGRPQKLQEFSSKPSTSTSSLGATVGYYFAVIGFILLVAWIFFALVLRFQKMLAVGVKFNLRKLYTEGEWPEDEKPKSKKCSLLRNPSFIERLCKALGQKSITDVEREYSSENSADKSGRKVSPHKGRRKRYTKRKPVEPEKPRPCRIHISEPTEHDYYKKRRKLKNIYEDEVYESSNQEQSVRRKGAGSKTHRKHSGHPKRPQYS